MSFSDFLRIFKSVLLDWRVIATVITMLLAVTIANKIVHYKKRPKRPKVKKTAAPAPAPAPEAKPESEEKEEPKK